MPILVILKIEYRLSRRKGVYAASQTTVLHMKRLNQTEFPIFVSKGNLFLAFIEQFKECYSLKKNRLQHGYSAAN